LTPAISRLQVSRKGELTAGPGGATLVVCCDEEATLEQILQALPPPPPAHERMPQGTSFQALSQHLLGNAPRTAAQSSQLRWRSNWVAPACHFLPFPCTPRTAEAADTCPPVFRHLTIS